MADKDSVIEKAAAGAKLSDSEKNKLVGEVGDLWGKVTGTRESMTRIRKNAGAAGIVMLDSGISGSTAFVSGVAEGKWGRDKMFLKGVPVRGTLGILGKGFQLYRTLAGKSDYHLGAAAQGFIDADLASFGMQVGKAMNSTDGGAGGGGGAKADPPAPPPAADPNAAPPKGLDKAGGVALSGPLREIALSGDDAGDEAGGRGRVRRNTRFIEVEAI